MSQNLICHYSLQKPMGRPPKKRARQEDEDALDLLDSTSEELLANLGFDWRLGFGVQPESVMTTSDGLGPLGFPPNIDMNLQFQQGPDQRLEQAIGSGMPWSSPVPMSCSPQSIPAMGTNSSVPPSIPMPTTGTQDQDMKNCPCLSYMYLTLSALCMINTGPITFQTIHTIENATRTAQAVLRCETCPRSFMTSAQNVSLLSALFNILVDLWVRIWESDPETLFKQLASPAYQHALNAESPEVADASRRYWLRQFVRRGLIGGHIAHEKFLPSIYSVETPAVLSLIREMEDRQLRWHTVGVSRPPMALNPSSSSSPSSHASELTFLSNSSESMATDATTYSSTTMTGGSASFSNNMGISGALSTPGAPSCPGEQHEKFKDAKDKYVCLKILEAAKAHIQKLGFDPTEYPEGVEPL